MLLVLCWFVLLVNLIGIGIVYILKLTMPPCKWDEILNIRLVSSPDEHCPLGPLKDRFNVWGGVPRTILFEPTTLLENEATFRRLNIAAAMEYLGTSRVDRDKHSGTIFRLLPSFSMIDKEDENTTLLDKYRRNSVFWWATPVLEQRNFRESQEADVLNFIQTLSNKSTSRGEAWEAEIHHIIHCVGI